MKEESEYSETCNAGKLGDEYTLISDSQEVNHVLDNIGVNHDPDSIVLEDSYSSLFVQTGEGYYREVWGVHQSTVRNHNTAYRLL